MAEAQATPQAPQAPQSEPARDARGVPDIVQTLQGILDSEKNPPQPEPQAQEAAPEPEAPAGPNKQPEGDEPKEAKPAEQAEQQPEEVTELPLEQVEAVELEVTVKADDGKDVVEKLPVKELKLGYMRQKDYQRKTAEVARQREELAEKSRQAVEGERKHYAEQLAQLQALVVESVAPELKDTDLNKLATDDPFEYVKRRNRLDQIQQTLSRVQQAQQELSKKNQADFEGKRKEALSKARETLQNDIPGWNDTLYQQLMKAGEGFGFTAEEVANWHDPRAIKLLYAAEKAKTAAPVKPSPDKKVVVVPKAVKPGPSAAVSQARQTEQNALERLGKSHKIDDAAAVIRARMR